MKKQVDKSNARTYKIVGGGLILISFIIQNFAYDYWNQESEEYINANRDFSAMSRSSLLYLNLFFSADVSNDTLNDIMKQQYINMAAYKYALGKSTEIVIRDIEKQKKIDLSNAFIQKAKAVKDFDSYLEFINFVNVKDTYSEKENVNRIESINKWRTYCRWIFLVSYIIGSLILLKGLNYE